MARAARPGRDADDQRRAARPDRHRRHAAAAAALPRPVRDGLQQLEHVLDVRRRAPHGARPTGGSPSARCSTHGQPAPGTDSVGVGMGANEFAHGAGARRGTQRARVPARRNSTAPAVTPDGRADCEAGQQGYASAGNRFTATQGLGHPTSTRSSTTGHVREGLRRARRPRAPSRLRAARPQRQGHRARPGAVPAGETFTAGPAARRATREAVP